MGQIVQRVLLATTLLMTAGCDGGADDSAAGPGAAADHDQAEHTDAGSASPAVEHDHGTMATAEGEALPLRPIMQRLAAEMAVFTQALWLENYDEMTARAAAMAEHPHIAADELQRIERVLGADLGGFEAADEAVHTALVGLQEAAESRQLDVVLDRLGEVQRGCMSCHTQFRERLRTDTVAAP